MWTYSTSVKFVLLVFHMIPLVSIYRSSWEKMPSTFHLLYLYETCTYMYTVVRNIKIEILNARVSIDYRDENFGNKHLILISQIEIGN